MGWESKRHHISVAVLHFDDGSHIKLRAFSTPLSHALTLATGKWRNGGEISDKLRQGLKWTLGAVKTWEIEDFRDAKQWYANGKASTECAICACLREPEHPLPAEEVEAGMTFRYPNGSEYEVVDSRLFNGRWTIGLRNQDRLVHYHVFKKGEIVDAERRHIKPICTGHSDRP